MASAEKREMGRHTDSRSEKIHSRKQMNEVRQEKKKKDNKKKQQLLIIVHMSS